jgi:hypothetical protein
VVAGSVLVAVLVFLIVNTRLSADNKISEVTDLKTNFITVKITGNKIIPVKI